MTYCEVIGVEGVPGNYKVRIRKKAKRVDLADCIGCGICSEKCPSKTVSEFDAGITLRTAIYIPFPQAVPNKYLIDAASCIYVQKGKCGVCVKVCPPNCINLDEKDQEVEINVGNIIVSTGFKVFDAKRVENLGYGKYPNVVTSLEFERLVNAAGPTEGNIKFRSKDKKGNWIFSPESDEPKSVALIHCVGSRDENYNKYCSRVCCMYSLKLAHLVKEKIPEAEVYEYFIDMRAFGKGYEEFYERIKEEGVHIIRGQTAKIEERDDQLILRSEDILAGKLIEQKVDMAILAVGLEPREDAEELSKMLGIKQGEQGWFVEANSVDDTVGTFTGGITIAGVCQGPKDIPDAVAQGSAAASRVLQSIIKGKVKKSIKDISLEQIETKVNQYTNIMEGIS
ncbi:MAG: CoB--CoM heterodisulfide reductase iron-sulfur subunit A family protein [Bacteroidetes bacterium]|nr:CoB--CoM heterodisulfide reductase iron-sulfur subunit A family protein [Bacteroidota bacterium]